MGGGGDLEEVGIGLVKAGGFARVGVGKKVIEMLTTKGGGLMDVRNFGGIGHEGVNEVIVYAKVKGSTQIFDSPAHRMT